MNDTALNTSINHMRLHWNKIDGDETTYKLREVAKIRESFEQARQGDLEWKDVLKQHRKFLSFHLGWRALDDLFRLATEHPQALRAAVNALFASRDADAFWDELALSVESEQELDDYRQLKGVGAQAAAASLFLFLDDAKQFPMFRSRNFGSPLECILGHKLDRSTPGSLLPQYYDGLTALLKRYQAAGLPAETPLDVQGTLWVLNYMNVLEKF